MTCSAFVAVAFVVVAVVASLASALAVVGSGCGANVKSNIENK